MRERQEALARREAELAAREQSLQRGLTQAVRRVCICASLSILHARR